MSRALFAICVAAVFGVAVLAACGGSGSHLSTASADPSKAEWVRSAEKICKASERAQRALSYSVAAEGSHLSAEEKQFRLLHGRNGLLAKERDELIALPIPPTASRQVEAITAAIEGLIAGAEVILAHTLGPDAPMTREEATAEVRALAPRSKAIRRAFAVIGAKGCAGYN